MTAASTAAAGRLANDRILLDTCTIVRTTRGPLNTTTGTYPTLTTSVWSGPCRVKAAPPRDATAGDVTQQARRPLLRLPADCTADIHRGDIVTVTSTAPGMDGSRWVVVDPDPSTTATARRFLLEEAPSGR